MNPVFSIYTKYFIVPFFRVSGSGAACRRNRRSGSSDRKNGRCDRIFCQPACFASFFGRFIRGRFCAAALSSPASGRLASALPWCGGGCCRVSLVLHVYGHSLRRPVHATGLTAHLYGCC